MRIAANPRLLALLSASYALGTLRGPARRRFEALAREQAAVRASALLWRERLASFVELSPEVDVPPAVWVRVRKLIEHELAGRAAPARDTGAAQKTKRASSWQSMGLWQSLAVGGCALAAVLGILLEQTRHEAPLALQYVSILTNADGSPFLLATVDAGSHRVALQRLGAYRESVDRSLQLWAIPAGGSPRSLGLLPAAGPGERLDADAGLLGTTAVLAVSLEPKGGVRGGGGPSGPVLFKGPLVEKTS